MDVSIVRWVHRDQQKKPYTGAFYAGNGFGNDPTKSLVS